MASEVLEYYQRGGERDRLAVGFGPLEFLRTWDILERVLPLAPATVLDVGGATGVYAEPLTRAGYRVHVLDPVASQVAVAAQRPGVTAAVADARALPVIAGRADAVLLLGPLYHLLDRADRVTAWHEAARAVRPAGVVVGAIISRFATLFDGFIQDFYRDPGYRPVVEGALADGRHRNTEPGRQWFTSAYFHHPDELQAEVADAGLTLRRRVAVEGPLWLMGHRRVEVMADAHRRELWLTMMRRVEEDPSLLGATSHLLVVAEKCRTPLVDSPT
ncbi:methyltransferase [Paractinoplanes rishiriensis]|uniref:Methyltransferase n=1 Tax=Paractinoplanes rishiriensis TaxID=1050105 RepID=A0A919N0I5_9ACTN|nr:methyltransferase [Actinoplanes rishiriensis]